MLDHYASPNDRVRTFSIQSDYKEELKYFGSFVRYEKVAHQLMLDTSALVISTCYVEGNLDSIEGISGAPGPLDHKL